MKDSAELDLKLKEAIRLSLHDAWRHLGTKYPDEQIYAFGVYTTEDAEYFVPFACGERGLEQVAATYVERGDHPDLETAKKELRWSAADSPYHEELALLPDSIDECLEHRDSPFDDSTAIAVRETSTRLEIATAALKQLDKTGLFGKGDARSKIVLLIEAGDRDNQWVQDHAKKLNPRPIFEAYRKQLELPAEGTYTEWGSQKVYATNGLALSHDCKFLAAATEYRVVLFDVPSRKQLWSRAMTTVRGDYVHVDDVAISADGSCIAAIGSDQSSEKKCVLSIWRDRLKERIQIDLSGHPQSVVMAPDSTWFAASTTGNPIQILDSKGKFVRKLEGFCDGPTNLSASLDGGRLAAADDSSGICVWDTDKWTVVWRSPLCSDCAYFDAAGKRLVTTLGSILQEKDPGRQLIRLWDAHKGTVIREFSVPGFKFNTASLSPDGRTIACGAEAVNDFRHKLCILLDATTGKVIERLRLGIHIDWFNHLLFLSKNEVLVAAQGHTLKPVVCWQLKKMP